MERCPPFLKRGLAEIAALELPLFLDRNRMLAYEESIFTHNARLVEGVRKNNRLFESDIYPGAKGDGVSAPYCTFRLRQPSDDAYARLENRIRSGIARVGILLECGGSFGFRGHRYEVVRPEGAPAFLRVALGRRPGASLERTIALFQELAALPNA